MGIFHYTAENEWACNKSKKKDKDQESIQSSTTPDPLCSGNRLTGTLTNNENPDEMDLLEMINEIHLTL